MKKYEYKFVEIPRKSGLKVRTGDTFEECIKVIIAEAEQGWRFKQIVILFDEKTGMFIPYSYQIIFESETE